jgi:N-acetylmuramoyl-L-alanine amidase
MIIILRKNNILLVVLIFVLSIALYSLNIMRAKDTPAAAGGEAVSQRKVVIDAGHGGEDPGAVSDYSGLKEKDVNLSIAKKVQKLLEADNYKVIMTREEDVLVYQEGITSETEMRRQDLTRRKKLIDESGADIVVSIHLNKFPQSKYFGAQAFYPPESPESRRLAECLQKAIKQTVDPNNTRKAHVEKKPFIILKNLKVPTVFVECGFLSNPEEEKKLAQEEYQFKLAAAIKQGIDDYFASKR